MNTPSPTIQSFSLPLPLQNHSYCLEAFYNKVREHIEQKAMKLLTAVNDTRARFVVLLLRAPEILEGAKRSQNGSTNPYRVLSLRRCNNLDLNRKEKKNALRIRKF